VCVCINAVLLWRDDVVGDEGWMVTDRFRKRRSMGLVHTTKKKTNVKMENDTHPRPTSKPR